MPQSRVSIAQALKIAQGNYAKGQWRKAAQILHQVAQRQPDHTEAIQLYTKVLMQLNRPAQAEAPLRRALETSPGNIGLLNGLGLCLVLLGRFDEARDLLERVEARMPYNPVVHRNIGLMHFLDHDYETSETAFRKAIDLDAGFISAHHNLANALEAMARFDDAIEVYNRAWRLAPNDVELQFDRGLCYLRAGNYERGFADYEVRLRRRDQRARHQLIKAPLWDGGDFSGKTLVVYGEQGFGDMIQCARYLGDVKARGGSVVFQAPRQIKRLLETVDGIDHVVTPEDELPPVDLKIPVFSLPGLFHTRWPDVPADVPYVKAAPSVEATLDGEGLRVGLVWAGSAVFKGDHTRSMRHDDLSPLFDVPGVTFYSLQFGASATEVDGRIRDLGDDGLGDFYQTGGIIERLDLLISVDTVTVHLAGALDRPVWVLLPFACDWRWAADGARSPWYPSVRLYRQPEPKAWDKVVARVAEDLAALARH